MTLNNSLLDAHRIRTSFDRAADSYDLAAALQRRTADRLVTRISGQPQRILDAGCGTGYATALLQARHPEATLTALDLAAGMLHATRQRLGKLPAVCADMQALPLANARFDLIFSNLMLQWCNTPEQAFAEAWRCLEPGGQFVFSTFGPDTLCELRDSFADGKPHVSHFPSAQTLQAQLQAQGFREIECYAHLDMLHYENAKKLMLELRAIGAGNAATDRRRGLTGKAAWQTMLARYEQLRTTQGLPASYALIEIRAVK